MPTNEWDSDEQDPYVRESDVQAPDEPDNQDEPDRTDGPDESDETDEPEDQTLEEAALEEAALEEAALLGDPDLVSDAFGEPHEYDWCDVKPMVSAGVS
ncbi:uncharacterized protein PG986_008817 [Apiospora aurea]|uniref:Uncharacterized protein n=1 Tax=Apiospora aurea TaxID=335848 RepID=A0ABR1Q5U4_9PEZI